MNLRDGQLERLDQMQDQLRLSRKRMDRDAFQSSPQSIIVELFGCDAVVITDPGTLGSFAEFVLRFGIEQSIADHDLHQRPQRHFAFPRNVFIDHSRQPHLLQIRHDDRQRSNYLTVKPSRGIYSTLLYLNLKKSDLISFANSTYPVTTNLVFRVRNVST